MSIKQIPPKKLTLDRIFPENFLKALFEMMDNAKTPLKADDFKPMVLSSIDQINEITGQENSPDYLAYALEHIFSQLQAARYEIEEGKNILGETCYVVFRDGLPMANAVFYNRDEAVTFICRHRLGKYD